MKKYKNFSGHSFGIYLKDWFELGYRATSVLLTEELGENIASGAINLSLVGSKEVSQDQLDTLYKTSDGTLYLYRNNSNNEPYEDSEYEIPIFITSKKRERSDVSISFICCKNGKEFYNNKQEFIFSSLMDAVETLYTGKIDKREDPDDYINSLEVHINHETPYTVLKKMLYSYKKDVIFSFGWEGLLIRSVKPGENLNSWGSSDIKTLVIGTDFHQIGPHNYEYGKAMHESSFNPWEKSENEEEEKESECRPDVDYKELQSKNIRSQIMGQAYFITRTDHYVKQENYIRNLRYTTYGSFSDVLEVIGTTMPNVKLGDIVKVEKASLGEKDSKIPFSIYIVAENEAGLSYEGGSKARKQGRSCWWKMKLICLQDFINSDTSEEISTEVQDITEQN